MGEDIDFDKSQSSDSHSHKFGNLSINGPQQELSESSPLTVGLNQGFVTHTDYDKLCLSLLSCLPNEQELALNVCTILSNEGNYMLHLEQTPKLVELLVAQTGVWSLDDSSLKMIYLECWKGLKGRNVHRFWRSCLDLENKDLIELLGLDLGDYDPDFSLLNLEIDLGIHNIEGQRVSRVALILHNLSFEKNNVPILVSSKTFIRFMLLCIHSSYGNLKQIAYDTLSNLACAIKLSVEKDLCSRLIFKTVMGGILSYDRYMNVRSMDILAQLCSHESNEDIIPSLLDIEVYRQMVSFLTVHDIMLLFYALEALYALSDLGRYACDKIVSVHRCIGALVSLLTLEPNEYGPSGQINMKVVKTLVPVDADTEKEDSNAATEEESPSPAPASAPTVVSSTEVDSETFAVTWLRSSYEVFLGKSVSRNEIYSDYLTYCTKAGRKDIANANIFTEYVRKTFPSCGVKKMESKGIITFHHEGLQRKNSAAQTGISSCKPVMNTNTIQKASTVSTPVTKANQKTTFNSILKSQLSSAPKSNVVTTPIKSQSPATVSNQKLSNAPFSPAVTPRTASPTVIANAGSSTLIKSLLASKVQQRNLQPQIVPQNVSKMVIYSPGTSVGFGSHTTVVRCIRPGSLHAVNLGAQLRTPLQTCLVSNSGRIIANATPRFIKNTPVIRHNVQQQIIKQNVPSSPTPRVNGLQKDVPMEEEVFKISKDAPASVITHTNTEQNHVSKDHGIAQHSTLSNGQDQQVSKSVNLNSDLSVNCSSGIQNFDMHKLAVSKELPISQHMISSKPPSTESSPSKEQKETSINFDNKNNPVANISLEQSSVQSTKALSSPTSILKHVLSDLDTQTDHLSKQQLLQKDICKRAPLLNGLLDKGKLPVQGHIQTNAFVLNGSEPNTAIQTVDVINSKENKPSQFVQLNQNSIVIPVSSLNTVMSAPQSNLILMPVSSVNSVIPSSPLNSSILAAASVNSTTAFISTSSPSVQLSNSVLPSTTFLSNGSNLMQLCIGQTTLSGTAEVQSDQQGVVRLHIESPENSNQGSDLSSISDITRTLECASKALLKTNVECSSQVPFSGTCETTSSTSLVTTNSSTLTRTSQQFFVVTPTLNQPQIQIPQPNIKFHILHSLPKVEDSVDLIGFPGVNVNQSLQLQQSNVNQSIQLQQANVNQTIQLQQSNVNQPIQLQQSNVNQSIQLQQPNVNQSIQLQQSNVNQSIQLQQPNVNQSIQLQQSNVNQLQQPLVNQSIQLQQPNVSQSIQLQQPNINQSIQLQQPNVNQSIHLQQSNVNQTMQLQQPNVNQTMQLQQSNVNQSIQLQQSNVNQSLQLQQSNVNQSLQLQQSNVNQSLQLQQSNVNQSLQLQQSNVNQSLQLQQSNVNQSLQLQQSNVNQSLQLQQSNVNQSLQLQQSNLNQSIQLQHQPTVNQSVQLQHSLANQSVHLQQSNISQSVQLQQPLPETSTTSTTCLKRPSNDTSLIQTVSNAKKPCIETKTSLLAESLRLPTSVPCTFDLASVSAKPSQETSVKPFQETKSIVVKSPQIENSELSSKLTTAKVTPKPLQKVDVPHDKGARTFSGLSSVNSNQAQTSPSPVPPKSAAGLEFLCEWKNCGLKFKSPALVYLHASKVHAPLSNNDMICLWEGCDTVRRRRLSLLTHLQDWHCNEVVLQTQAMRRKQISQTGKSSIAAPQKPPPHPGYAPDAAMLAIKRHALQYINPKELSEEKESVLTKSIRLTSALILRNLVTHSTLARTYVRRFEPELAYLAMSPVESARTLAQCLSQLHSVND